MASCWSERYRLLRQNRLSDTETGFFVVTMSVFCLQPLSSPEGSSKNGAAFTVKNIEAPIQ